MASKNQIAVAITMDSKGFTRDIKAATASLRTFSTVTKAAATNTSALTKNIRSASTSARTYAKNLTASADGMKAYLDGVRKANTATGTFFKKVDTAAASTRTMKAALQDSKSAANTYSVAMNGAGRANTEFNSSVSSTARAVQAESRAMTTSLNQVGVAAKANLGQQSLTFTKPFDTAMVSAGNSAQTQTGRIRGAFGSLAGGVIAGAIGGAVYAGISTAVQAVSNGVSKMKTAIFGFNSTLQNSTIAFTTLLGSGQASQQFLNQLQAFAKTTPFEFQGLVQNAQLMMGMGIAAKSVIPDLTALGDSAASVGATQDQLNTTTLAFAQIQAKGKLSMDNVNQLLQGAMPSALKVLSAQYHVTTGEMVKMISSGDVMASKALPLLVAGIEKGTSATAALGGMMDKQSQTFTGAASNIADGATQLTAKAFKPLFDATTKGFISLASFLGSNVASTWADTIATKVQGVITWFDKLKTGMNLGGIKAVFTQVSGAVQTFGNAFGPVIGQVGLAISALSPVGLLLKGLSPVLGQLASAVAPVAATFASQLVPIITQLALQVIPPVITVITALAGALTSIMPTIGGLAQTLGQSLAVAVQAFGPVLTTVASAVSQILPVVAGAFKQLLPAIQPLIGVLGTVLGTAIQAVLPIITTLAGVFAKLLPVIVPLATTIGQVLGTALTAVMPIVTALSNVFATLLPVIVPLATTIGQVLGTALTAVAPLLTLVGNTIAQLLPVVTPVITLIGGALTGVLKTLMPIVSQVVGILVTSLKPVFAALTPIIAAVVPIIGTVVGVVGSLVSALAPLLPPIAELVGSLLGPLAETLGAILPPILNLVNVILGVVVPILKVLISIIVHVIEAILAILKPLIQLVVMFAKAFAAIIAGAANFVSVIVKFIGGLIDNIVSFFGGAINWLVDAGGNILKGLINGIKAVLKPLADLLGGIGKGLAKVFGTSGKESGDAFGKNLQKSVSKVKIKLTWNTTTDTSTDVGIPTSVKGIAAAQAAAAKKAAQKVNASASFSVTGVGSGGGVDTSGITGAGDAAKTTGKAAKTAADKAKAAAKKLADWRASLKKVENLLSGGFDADKIKAQLKSVNQAIKDGFSNGLISSTQEKTALELVSKTNAKLQTLATQRAKMIEDATKLQSDVQSSALSAGSVTNGGRFSDISRNMSNVLAWTRRFQTSLGQLKGLGLNRTALSQLISEFMQDPKAALASANAILTAGKGGVGQLNSTMSQIKAAAGSLGNDAAFDEYGKTGENVAKGFVAGLKSQQKALEKEMTSLGDALVKSLNKSLKIKSPSRRTMESGAYVVKGAVLGILNEVKSGGVNKAMASLSSAVMDSYNVNLAAVPVPSFAASDAAVTNAGGSNSSNSDGGIHVHLHGGTYIGGNETQVAQALMKILNKGFANGVR